MPRRKSTKILADEASKAPFQDPKANDLAIIMPSVNHSKPIVLGDRVKVYGHFFPKAEFPNMLAVELWCFLHGLGPEVGGLGKYQHFKNSVDLWFNDPKVDCTKRFDWHPWAVEMAQAACENQYLAIAGCASSGKTDFAAMWALINWLAAPLNTMVLVTSTTLKDSRRRIWGSVREYFQARQGLPGKLVDSYGLIRLDDPSGKFQGSDRCGISLIAAEKKMEKEAVGKLIGFKNQRVIMVADELPELSSAILEACYGNLSRNPEFQLLGLGNPNSYYDAFGQFAKPKGGWSSINSESHIWETERGRCLRFDGKLSPNLAAGKTIYPYLLTQERYDEDVRQFGENSATFWRMIRGFWSPTGTLESVYSEADIIRSKADEKVVWVEPPIRLAALDPSFTNGGDRTVAVIGSYGTSIGPDGNPLTALQFDEFHILYEDILDTKTPRTFQIATAFRNLCLEHGITPDNAALDASGAGTPFADVLSTLWSNKVHRINFAGRASDVPVSAFDQTPSRDRYANRVSEIWFSGRELMHMGQLKGVTPEMAREMCARLYKTEKGVTTRVRVEPKPDMKERTKGVSPDLADAAFILLDLCRSKFRMASVAQAADRPTGRKNSWMQIARRSDVVSRSNRRLRR